ncbi:MAG: hypothetical protein KDB16_13185 [Acidimicrobiales bacterium]|nr:hypothetical protein [Acidimicrobiales bacterium]
MVQRDLAGQHPEQERVVGGLESVVVLEGQLELRLVELGVDRLEFEPAGPSGAHDVVYQTVGVGGLSGSVHHRARRLPAFPAALAVGLENIGLQLDTDLGAVSQVFPGTDGLLQRVTR